MHVVTPLARQNCSASTPSEVPPPIHVGVQVDEARRDEVARHVAHLGCGAGGEIGADRGDFAFGKADVGDRVEVLRRIDDPPALEDEIDRHQVSRCRRPGRPIHGSAIMADTSRAVPRNQSAS
jgi:hypothetical protein